MANINEMMKELGLEMSEEHAAIADEALEGTVCGGVVFRRY